jgi:hypothetical protein
MENVRAFKFKYVGGSSINDDSIQIKSINNYILNESNFEIFETKIVSAKSNYILILNQQS